MRCIFCVSKYNVYKRIIVTIVYCIKIKGFSIIKKGDREEREGYQNQKDVFFWTFLILKNKVMSFKIVLMAKMLIGRGSLAPN